jgi:3-oxoacid CoA-transferase B subunit
MEVFKLTGDIRHRIAKRAADELEKYDVVNLGVGIPVLVVEHLDKNKEIIFQSENGMLGVGPEPTPEQFDPFIINAGRKPATVITGASFSDSSVSFGIIRGGHLDVTIIGALQVSETGDIANWVLPGKDILGMGGAMDLVVGAKKVIVAMQHISPKGERKILKECTIPLTAPRAAHVIITEFALFRFCEGKMYLEEIDSSVTLDEVRDMTPASYEVSVNLKTMGD